jgi:hypothetical protein
MFSLLLMRQSAIVREPCYRGYCLYVSLLLLEGPVIQDVLIVALRQSDIAEGSCYTGCSHYCFTSV